MSLGGPDRARQKGTVGCFPTSTTAALAELERIRTSSEELDGDDRNGCDHQCSTRYNLPVGRYLLSLIAAGTTSATPVRPT